MGNKPKGKYQKIFLKNILKIFQISAFYPHIRSAFYPHIHSVHPFFSVSASSLYPKKRV
jgi:hypothetical protein